jgi:hypothetical protein
MIEFLDTTRVRLMPLGAVVSVSDEFSPLTKQDVEITP